MSEVQNSDWPNLPQCCKQFLTASASMNVTVLAWLHVTQPHKLATQPGIRSTARMNGLAHAKN